MTKKRKIFKKRNIFLLTIGLILIILILLIFNKKNIPIKNQEIFSPREEVIHICDTCQGHFGDMDIGVDSTKYADYLDEQGIKRHGSTARLWIGNKVFTVHNFQTLEIDEYSIFVEKISVGSRITGTPSGPPPPVGGGEGGISLRIKTDLKINHQVQFFDFVTQLESFPTLSPDDISKILNVALVKNTEEVNRYYFIREAKGNNIAGFFKSVELRTPVETNKGGLLILDLMDNSDIVEKDILQKYPKAVSELAEATAPLTVPYDWMIKKSWGKVSFQITRDGSKKVISVILDSID